LTGILNSANSGTYSPQIKNILIEYIVREPSRLIWQIRITDNIFSAHSQITYSR